MAKCRQFWSKPHIISDSDDHGSSCGCLRPIVIASFRASAIPSKCYATIRGPTGGAQFKRDRRLAARLEHTGTAVVSKLFSEPCTSCMEFLDQKHASTGVAAFR
jgi:hypothetical protein